MEQKPPSSTERLLGQASAFAMNFGTTLVGLPAVLATGYKIFGKKPFTQEYARLFKSPKIIGFSAALGAIGVVFERMVQNFGQSQPGFEREELRALREHVYQEGLTISFDHEGTTLRKYVGGKTYPIEITQADGGQVLITPKRECAKVQALADAPNMSHASKVEAEKAAAAEAERTV